MIIEHKKDGVMKHAQLLAVFRDETAAEKMLLDVEQELIDKMGFGPNATRLAATLYALAAVKFLEERLEPLGFIDPQTGQFTPVWHPIHVTLLATPKKPPPD